jgi:hypothetical protein
MYYASKKWAMHVPLKWNPELCVNFLGNRGIDARRVRVNDWLDHLERTNLAKPATFSPGPNKFVEPTPQTKQLEKIDLGKWDPNTPKVNHNYSASPVPITTAKPFTNVNGTPLMLTSISLEHTKDDPWAKDRKVSFPPISSPSVYRTGLAENSSVNKPPYAKSTLGLFKKWCLENQTQRKGFDSSEPDQCYHEREITHIDVAMVSAKLCIDDSYETYAWALMNGYLVAWTSYVAAKFDDLELKEAAASARAELDQMTNPSDHEHYARSQTALRHVRDVKDKKEHPTVLYWCY